MYTFYNKQIIDIPKHPKSKKAGIYPDEYVSNKSVQKIDTSNILSFTTIWSQIFYTFDHTPDAGQSDDLQTYPDQGWYPFLVTVCFVNGSH